VPDLGAILGQHERMFDLKTFERPDFYVSLPFLQGVIAAESYKKEGIPIHALGEKKVFPLYGVSTPTSPEYLDLLSNYLKQLKTLPQYKSLVDLGSGTGVLSLIAAEAGFKGRIYSIDQEPNAIESTQMNHQIFGLFERSRAIEADIVDLYLP